MDVKQAVDDPVEPYGPLESSLQADVIARLRAELAATKARLAEVERLADRDPLAPVLNRRAFIRELQRTIAYCQRYGAEAALVFFDLDGFKQVNDDFGHAAGDQALKAAASTLAANVRESDVVGRLGGDEFGVILAQVGRAAAADKAAALAQAIARTSVIVQGRAIALEASFGVRAFELGVEAAQMLAEADAAMFIHKGRRAAAPLKR
jgi:diguanylate cyclase (GGDEF)-like protein